MSKEFAGGEGCGMTPGKSACLSGLKTRLRKLLFRSGVPAADVKAKLLAQSLLCSKLGKRRLHKRGKVDET
jgi:hypothetical protein